VTFLRDAQADSVIIATKQSTSGRLLPILHALQEEFCYIDEAAELLIADGDPFATRTEARLGVPMGTTTPDGGVTLEPVYCAVAPRLQAAE